MLMHNQHLYQGPTIEVYGPRRLLLRWLSVPSWFFCNPGLKNCSHERLVIEPTTLDLGSQSGAYNLSATATLIAFLSLYYFYVFLRQPRAKGCLDVLPQTSNVPQFKS